MRKAASGKHGIVTLTAANRMYRRECAPLKDYLANTWYHRRLPILKKTEIGHAGVQHERAISCVAFSSLSLCSCINPLTEVIGSIQDDSEGAFRGIGFVSVISWRSLASIEDRRGQPLGDFALP